MIDNLPTASNQNKKRIKLKQYKNLSLLFQYNNKTCKHIQKIKLVLNEI